MDHQLPGPSKIRKRATKACLACRARKVRCDVSQRGRPCMNCYLDGESCVVIGRASRRRKSKDGGDNDAGAAADDGHSQGRDSGDLDPALAQSASADGDVLMDTPSDGGSERLQVEMLREAGHGFSAINPPTNGGGGSGGSGGIGRRPAAAQARDVGSYGGPSAQQYYSSQHEPVPHQNHHQQSSARARLQQLKWAGEQSMTFGSDIAYTYYPFLTLDDLPDVLPQDVSYLEMQGCLRVPVRTILDEFVKQYFLHVHPIMPLLNESEVWEMYASPSAGATSSEHLSLLVWQAMLFAACNYVPRNTLRALGFVDVRAARAAFYRRTKLLFDFDVESSPVATAQAALLLSSWHPDPARSRTRTGSSWLGIAIEQAMLAGAHRSARPYDGPAIPTMVQAHTKLTLQRLWWCIVLHDRIASLCARRPLQVTRARFDYDSREGLPIEPASMQGERNGSKVYNIETKTSLLIGVFPELLRLAGVLTDLLSLIEAQDGMPQWSRRYGPEARARVEECKSQMRAWCRVAFVNVRPPGGRRSGRQDGDDGREEEFTHDSVVLYTDLMYLLYHSAMARLCHFECLRLIASTRWEGVEGASASDRAMMRQTHRDIQKATYGVITCLRDLAQHRLLRWLPPILIGCISLPLILSIIDAKLSPQPDAKLHDLRQLDELLRAYQPHQDTPDWISDALRAILDHAQLDDPHRLTTITIDADEAQDAHPSVYLRLGLGQDASTRNTTNTSTTSASQSLARLFPRLLSTPSLARTYSMLKSQGQPQPQTYTQTHYAATSRASSSFSPSPAGGSLAPPPARDDSSLHHHSHQQQQQQQQNQQQMMMAEWMSQDQAVSYGMQLGIVPPELPAGEDGSRPSAPVAAAAAAGAISGKTAYEDAQPSAVGALREVTTAAAAAADWDDTTAWAFSEAGDRAEGRLLEAFVFKDQPHLIGGSAIPEPPPPPPPQYQHQYQHQHQHQQQQQPPQSQLATAQQQRFSNNTITGEVDAARTRGDDPEAVRGGRDESEREMMTTGRAFWSAVGTGEQTPGGRLG